MDCTQYITVAAERKKGQHLGREERGAIQYLKRHGLSNRAIARELGCSPTTVGNELRRGTPPRKSNKGRPPGYSAKRGEAVYKANRVRSKRNHKILSCTCFLNWTTTQVRVHKWSLDACVGYARLHGLFAPEEMVCTHTLYNEVWAGKLSLTATELPEALKRKQHKASLARENKKNYGNGISERPEIAALRIEEGHWEGDTVVGKRAGKEAVVLSLLEKKTENYIAMRIPGKDSASVLDAMRQLKEEYGDRFGQVFKTITVDNGSEFQDCAGMERSVRNKRPRTTIYYCHPSSPGERGSNENMNRIIRRFFPKGTNFDEVTAQEVAQAEVWMNNYPRAILEWKSAGALFAKYLTA